MENLLFAASRLSIISLISAKEIDDEWERTSLAYFRDNKEILKYDFYFDGSRYMIHLPAFESLYMVSLSGYQSLRLSGVFSPLTSHYIKQNLIALLPGDISSLTISVTGESKFTFTQDSAGIYECFDHIQQTIIPLELLNDHKVHLLLSYFSDIRYEESNNNISASSLRANSEDKMLARIEVISSLGESYSMEVYPFLNEESGTPEIFRALVIFNNQPTVLIINYIYLDVLMRDLESYIL